MFEFKKSLYGLKGINFPFVDSTDRAVNTFHIYDFPETFFLGKNQFKLFLDKDNLVNNSQIYIDIIDSIGNPIYYKVSNLVSPDRSRTIIVHIYDTTPIGECEVYIAGRLKRNPNTGKDIEYATEPTSLNYYNIPNVVWVGKVNISLTENVTDIVFDTLPSVTYSEERVPVKIMETGSRLVITTPTSSGTISLVSIFTPVPTTERINEGNVIEKFPTTFNSEVKVSPIEKVPEYIQFSVLTSERFDFSSSMVGGNIEINNIQYEYPNDYSPSTSFPILNYSGSLVSITNKNAIEIYPPFSKVVEYTNTTGQVKSFVVNKFFNHNNFTCSFLNERTFINSTKESKSYIKLKFENVEPEIGSVASIDVSYKEINSIGNGNNLGQFDVRPKNILVDPNTLVFTNNDGISEKAIGVFSSVMDAEDYWSGSTNYDQEISYARVDDVYGGVEIVTGNPTNQNQWTIFHPQEWINPTIYKNTEYVLEFDAIFSSNNNAQLSQQVDVYISGSTIEIPNTTYSINLPVLKHPLFGSYLGSVARKREKYSRGNKFYFRALETKITRPTFVIRSIDVGLANITIKPRQNAGYSPNYFETMIPVPDLESPTELKLEIKFLNSKNNPADYISSVYGLTFQGNTTGSLPEGIISSSQQVIFSQITGVPNGIISGSDQLTSSYDSRYERRGSGIISSSAQIIGFVSTASYQIDSSSWNSRIVFNSHSIDSINKKTGSFATTGSNIFIGNQIITGSLIVTQTISGSILSGSFVGNGSGLTNLITSSYAVTASYLNNLPSGIVSSSNQTDYNQLQNKLNVVNVAKYRLLISSGSESSSYASDNLRYVDSNASSASINWSRLKINGEIEQSFTSSFGNSSVINYVTQSTADVSSGTPSITYNIPLFRNNDNLTYLTGSTYTVALVYTIETLFFGRTGSISNPIDHYLWSSLIQGRLTIIPNDNTGQVRIYNQLNLSGSSVLSHGTSGNGISGITPKTNLDSWCIVRPLNTSGPNLIVEHRIIPTSSGNWQITASSYCKVIKHEFKY